VVDIDPNSLDDPDAFEQAVLEFLDPKYGPINKFLYGSQDPGCYHLEIKQPSR
jgi:hypothetical protein